MSPSPHTPLVIVGVMLLATIATPLLTATQVRSLRVAGIVEQLHGNSLSIRASDGTRIPVRVGPGTEITKLLTAVSANAALPLPHLERAKLSDLTSGARVSAIVQQQYAHIERALRIDIVGE